MGSKFLGDLAQVCRNAGLFVREEPGWQQRSNGSGGYDAGQPTHIMCHHTASPPTSDGQRDVDYICYGSPVKPISNLYLSRKGEVWVCAGGRTNTNGAGSSISWNGGVPNDRMNAYAISIEAANRGTGEPWPEVQQDAYVTLCSALSLHYGIPVSHVRAHFEWTSRKIDPAGQSRYATGSAKWNMDAFRSDVLLYDPSPPQPPQPPTQENDMVRIDLNPNTPQWVSMVIGPTTISHTVDGFHAAVLERAGVARVVVNERDVEGILRSLKATNDSPFAPGWASANASLHALWEAAKLKAV